MVEVGTIAATSQGNVGGGALGNAAMVNCHRFMLCNFVVNWHKIIERVILGDTPLGSRDLCRCSASARRLPEVAFATAM